ncbi:MAG: S49 family peptidase [Gammaproteobacteria bacterium]|nr:S49 family peptidase [Gammaproteobacteria bacterium]
MNTVFNFKSIFRIFGQTFFALVSFIVLLSVFSLFFFGVGIGLGVTTGTNSFTDFSEADSSSYIHVLGEEESENSLLTLPIDGVILGSPPVGSPLEFFGFGVTYGYGIQELLKEAEEDESIKGILLHMQTPGGTIFGAKAIFDGIKTYQDATGKPVLAYVEGISASGGVMAMVGADAIYADHGSLTGSIGVLGPSLTYFDKPTAIDGSVFSNGIVTEGGIEHTMISAGRSKDLGNPFRRATSEEIKNLQQSIDSEYDAFVRHVADNRDNLDEAMIRGKMGAQIFGNKAAQEYGLIDGILNHNEAVAKLAEMAGVKDDFELIRPRKDSSSVWEMFVNTGKSVSLEELQRRQVKRDICETAVRVPLVYHGDLMKLCF